MCGGIASEVECLPCLHGCNPGAVQLKQDADDMCMICFIEALSSAPAIQVILRFFLTIGKRRTYWDNEIL